MRGGIFNISNFKLISSLIIRGNDSIEDFEGNYYKYPYADAPYWQDKRVQMKKVNIPTYIMGSDVSSLHTMGALRAWLEIDTPHKWLRWVQGMGFVHKAEHSDQHSPGDLDFDRLLPLFATTSNTNSHTDGEATRNGSICIPNLTRSRTSWASLTGSSRTRITDGTRTPPGSA